MLNHRNFNIGNFFSFIFFFLKSTQLLTLPKYIVLAFSFIEHHLSLHKKWRFPLRISVVNVTKSAKIIFLTLDTRTYLCVSGPTCVYQGVRNVSFADLVTFTEQILNEKLHFLCSVCSCSICSWDLPHSCK